MYKRQIMKIDEKGNVIDHTIAETVIKVDRRMSYTSVKKILEEHDVAEIEEYKELVPMFERMKELAAILRKKRMKRGSIDFDFPETKIILDEQGKPVDIKPYDRNVATKIIEDFMLDIMYEIPKDDNIGMVTITKEYVEKKGGPLITMRGCAQIAAVE